jgi:hypothetical protein
MQSGILPIDRIDVEFCFSQTVQKSWTYQHSTQIIVLNSQSNIYTIDISDGEATYSIQPNPQLRKENDWKDCC